MIVRENYYKAHIRKIRAFLILMIFCLLVSGSAPFAYPKAIVSYAKSYSLSDVPSWAGKAYVKINKNKPSFSKKHKKKRTAFVKYYELDEYERPVKAYACLGPETLNDKEREGIGHIKPVGWETKKYPDIIEDLYVYNRCHLLMQAAAAGVKKDDCNGYKNLITGTRYLNVDGMLTFESRILSYIKRTGNHVLYRVTPVYVGGELIARGVQMEAYSLEDKGKGVKFNVYCYNMQPGITIDYLTGKTEAKEKPQEEMQLAIDNGATTVKCPRKE